MSLWDSIGIPTVENDDDLSAPVDYPQDDTSPPDDIVETSDTLACRECGKPLSYSGRGRKPTRCDDCKKPSSGRTGTRRSSTGNARLNTIRDSTQEAIAVIGMASAIPFPVTGTYVVSRSEGAAKAIIALAQNHPAILKALEKSSDFAASAELISVIIGVGFALQVDTGRIENPEQHMISSLLGVTAIYQQVTGSVSVQ